MARSHSLFAFEFFPVFCFLYTKVKESKCTAIEKPLQCFYDTILQRDLSVEINKRVDFQQWIWEIALPDMTIAIAVKVYSRLGAILSVWMEMWLHFMCSAPKRANCMWKSQLMCHINRLQSNLPYKSRLVS